MLLFSLETLITLTGCSSKNILLTFKTRDSNQITCMFSCLTTPQQLRNPVLLECMPEHNPVNVRCEWNHKLALITSNIHFLLCHLVEWWNSSSQVHQCYPQYRNDQDPVCFYIIGCLKEVHVFLLNQTAYSVFNKANSVLVLGLRIVKNCIEGSWWEIVMLWYTPAILWLFSVSAAAAPPLHLISFHILAPLYLHLLSFVLILSLVHPHPLKHPNLNDPYLFIIHCLRVVVVRSST